MLDKVDVKNIRDGEDFAKETLGKLVERKNLSFQDIVSRLKSWKKGTLEVTVDVIVSHDKREHHSPLLDEVLQADEGETVRSHVASYRTRR